MRRFALLIAFACCLLGVAAQPASAQQGQWAAARQQRRAMMRARRQAAARAYGAQGHSQANPRLSAQMDRRAQRGILRLRRAAIQAGIIRMKRGRTRRARLEFAC